MPSGLYGITHTNRGDDDHWGKNCFNSSFPASLACYFKDRGYNALYVKMGLRNNDICIEMDEIPISEVFNSGNLNNEQLEFDFEHSFVPYNRYASDLDPIDLVIRRSGSGEYLRPLEVKLTVLPYSASLKREESQWGSEIVVRAATTSYCAIGMFDAIRDQRDQIRQLFEADCSRVIDWKNGFEITHKTALFCRLLRNFQKQYYRNQKPLVMQPIWKTEGQKSKLANNAFDIVVWSDYAFSRLFLDRAESESQRLEENADKVSRPMRATARLVRCLWELSRAETISIKNIYREMAFDNKTDKEFSANGLVWRKYVNSDRITTPILTKDSLNEIIEPGYIAKLMPERRFDQTLYFNMVDREDS